MTQPAPFEISDGPQPGSRIATNSASRLALLDADGRVFRRRAIKVIGEGVGNVEWVVAELGGVRVYFDGVDVIVTRRDIYPGTPLTTAGT